MPVFRRQNNYGKKTLKRKNTNGISQDIILDFAFYIVSEVNYSLTKYDVEVKCMDFKVVDNDWLDIDIIDSNNATLGMKFRLTDLSPNALKAKKEAVTSVVAASYGELYMFLREGKL